MTSTLPFAFVTTTRSPAQSVVELTCVGATATCCGSAPTKLVWRPSHAGMAAATAATNSQQTVRSTPFGRRILHQHSIGRALGGALERATFSCSRSRYGVFANFFTSASHTTLGA